MSLDAKKLYELLPAIYLIRDSKQGEPLRALLDVIAEQARVIEEDIIQLYKNWFIETCDEWVVPYIGDLLGVRELHSISTGAAFTQRARVANTLGYRRRKGTAAVLEQLAYDASGWRARVVEFFELLESAQYFNHIRLHNLRTPDLRTTNELELLNTAFDTIAHTVDVRRISIGRGWHNIPNIGLFLWRLQSYPMTRSAACRVKAASTGRYTFSPLGFDSALFNCPQTETEITHLAEEINVPGLLRRRPLCDELEARRQALVENRTPEYIYFDDRPDTRAQPILEIFLDGSRIPIAPDEILICDLQDWHIPPDEKKYKHIKADGTYEVTDRLIRVAVDPVLGRMTFPASVAINEVHVSYAYGFSGDVGGGPYDRRESVSKALARKATWQVGVSKETASVPGKIFDNLIDAVKEWNKQPNGSVGIIAILDNQTYQENLAGGKRIKIPEASQLLIVAADWPEVNVPGGLPGKKDRIIGQLTPDERRPHLLGHLDVEGTADESSHTGGGLALDGLLVEGNLSILAGNLGDLRISHSTLVPARYGLEVKSKNDQLKIDLIRSICGPIKLTAAVSKLFVEESIVDNGSDEAISAILTSVELQKSTIFGSIHVLNIEAGNTIFAGRVDAKRQQMGCIRFSYVPVESKTPRRFRCQPDLEINTQISNAKEQGALSPQKENAIREHVLEWLIPAFISTHYGHYAYAQLSQSCPLLIREGAEDGSEMGVFSFLAQPQREANIRVALDEYLRIGLEAGIIYVT